MLLWTHRYSYNHSAKQIVMSEYQVFQTSVSSASHRKRCWWHVVDNFISTTMMFVIFSSFSYFIHIFCEFISRFRTRHDAGGWPESTVSYHCSQLVCFVRREVMSVIVCLQPRSKTSLCSLLLENVANLTSAPSQDAMWWRQLLPPNHTFSKIML